jgi:hypothetical protein
MDIRKFSLNLRSLEAALLATALVLLFTGFAGAQSAHAPDLPPKPATPAPKALSASEKAKLLDATRVSTEKAARRAAQEKAKDTTKEDTTKKQSVNSEAIPAVSEFKPVSKSQEDSSTKSRLPGQDTGKLPLKNLHGSVQGSTGSGIRQGAADLGASSKGGKTYIYVQSEKSRSDPATPQ